MSAASRIPFAAAAMFWLRLGFISFGGPTGQIAIMHRELVERRRWISERRFLHALNYCMLLPGPEAQQLATYLGWLMHRSAGGILAGTLFVLPSLLLLIALSWLYMAYGQLPAVAGIFAGIKPVVCAIVLQAAWRIGGRVLRNCWLVGIALAAFGAILFLGLPFPLVVAGAALLGCLGGRLRPQAFHLAPARSAAAVGPAALIDDDTPPPPHARFRPLRLLGVLVAAALLWGAPMALLTALAGWQHDLTQMGWFFTKAALLTFGGAYAVLPYVYQGAVLHYGWLTPAQMIDGLALGETTPGPLIMVVAFVGFVGGWQEAAVAASGALLSGPAILAMALGGALVATWFTFLPSFVFILAGGPLVEASRDEATFTAPLSAITAAAAGVILNLALFFASHVFWPRGLLAGPDWPALAIGAVAAVVLMRWRLSVLAVIAAAAALGLLRAILAG